MGTVDREPTNAYGDDVVTAQSQLSSPDNLEESLLDKLGAMNTNEPISSKKMSELKHLLAGNKTVASEDKYKDLKQHFNAIADKLQESSPKDYKDKVIAACNGLRQLYEHYRHDDSPKGMIARNDILEGLSVAFRNGDGINAKLNLSVDTSIQRIVATPLKDISRAFKKYDILLVAYKDAPAAMKAIESAKVAKAAKTGKKVDILTAEEIRDVLKKHNIKLQVEAGAHDKGIFLVYKHVHKGTTLARAEAALTKKKAKLKLNAKPLDIAKWLKKTHITLETNLGGELYAYKEAFTTEFRDAKSQDEAFRRKLSPLAENILLADARKQQSQIDDLVGTGHVIISNSFNRLSHYEVGVGEAGKREYQLVGKLMEITPGNIAKAGEEKPLNTSFGFSVAAMLGSSRKAVETEVDTKDVIKVSDFKALDPEIARRSVDTVAMEMMAKAANRQNWDMYIQRLAPEDIHHYAASINGVVLNRVECMKALQKMMEDAPAGELKQLQVLLDFYEEQVKQGDKLVETSSYLSVPGQMSSVNRGALSSRSDILSTNDRHIMMVRGEDGSISIHTFIGATAVDNVNITAKAGPATVGKDFGDMGHGRSPEFILPSLPNTPASLREQIKTGKLESRTPTQIQQQGVTTDADLKKMRDQEIHGAGGATKVDQQAGSVAAGKDMGGFGVGGSTVVSLFPKTHFRPAPAIADASSILQRRIDFSKRKQKVTNGFKSFLGKPANTIKVEDRSIEIKAELGDVIGLPMSYLAFNAFKNGMGKEFDALVNKRVAEGNDVESIYVELEKAFKEKTNFNEISDPHEKQLAKHLQEIIKKNPADLKPDETAIKDIMIKAVEFNIKSGTYITSVKKMLGEKVESPEIQAQLGSDKLQEIIDNGVRGNIENNKILQEIHKELIKSSDEDLGPLERRIQGALIEPKEIDKELLTNLDSALGLKIEKAQKALGVPARTESPSEASPEAKPTVSSNA